MSTGGARPALEQPPEPQAVEVLRAHAALLGRVCMALTGDAALTERALERVAAEIGAATFAPGDDVVVVRILAMARAACATQMSRLPVRTKQGASTMTPSARARDALGILKPTEREAVVLHLVGGLDAAQVARACNIDLETARVRLERGLATITQEKKR